jgi:hypothetical protein
MHQQTYLVWMHFVSLSSSGSDQPEHVTIRKGILQVLLLGCSRKGGSSCQYILPGYSGYTIPCGYVMS